MANEYITEAELEKQLGVSSIDSTLGDIVRESASRLIDDLTGRQFFKTSSATRYYDSHHPDDDGVMVFPDDILAVTTFKADSELDGTFDGESWVEGTDYVLWPYNATPYRGIKVTTYGNYSLLDKAHNIQVVGDFGYIDGAATAAPKPIKQAALWLAASLYSESNKSGYEQERMGEYFYKMADAAKRNEYLTNMVGPYRAPWISL